MEQRTYKLRDFAQDISVAIKDAQSHHLDKFVGLEHYDSGEPVITRYTNTDLITSSVKEFHKNDILIARRNVYLKRAGIAFFDGLTSGDSIILRIFDDCNDRTGLTKEDAIKIIPFVLNSNDFWAYANKHADGMNSKRISKEMLYDYEFCLPNLTEVRALYSKLWAAYNLKVSYKKLMNATDEMVKSQFIEMFGSETNKVLLEDVVFVKDDCRKPINEGVRSEMKEGELYPYYGATGVVDYINDYITDEELLCVAEDCGNYNAGEESAYIIHGKAWVNNHAHLVKMKEGCDIKYLYYYLKIANLMPYVSGTTRLKLTQKKLKEIPVVLPTTDKQKAFVAIAEQADKSKFELQKSIEAIDAVIKSLINC